MKQLISWISLFLFAVIGSWVFTEHQVYSQTEPKIEQLSAQFSQHFANLGIKGSIIIYDLNDDISYQHNLERNNTAFLPASTFKIPNSLIALETGIIESDVDVLTWDGIQRDLEQWNQDLNLRLAFKYSGVWFYQVLARKIGYQQMQDFVNRIQYGNRQIGNKDDIDTFWLSGESRITPQEQINFLRRLYQNDLPFSQRNINIVKDIAIVEQTPDYTLRAKTGWATSSNPQVGWYVGYLEQNDNVYFFATNLEIVEERESQDLAARLEVTRLCLQDLNLL